MTTGNTGIPIYNLMLLSVFLFCCGNQSLGQEKINVSAGLSSTEGLNVGLHSQLKQAQIRIGFGTVLLNDNGFISVSGDIYYHFAGVSELSDRRPWYGRIGLTYCRYENDYFINKDLFLNLQIGRDFNISRKIGIEFNVGPNFQLFHYRTEIATSVSFFQDLSFFVYPGFGICLFYRI
jgi:hypothetical protein